MTIINKGRITLDEYADIKKLLYKRMDEILMCGKIKAYFSAMILCGSTAEGILYFFATRYSNKKNVDEWSFNSLIKWAKNIGAISEDTENKLYKLKDVRNNIHIKLEYKNHKQLDENKLYETVKILKHLINEMYEYVLKEEGT